MTPRRLADVGRLLCLAGATLGAVGLLGAVTGAKALTVVVPGQPPMVPNTAMALLLLGVAGALRRQEAPGRMRWALSVTAAGLALVGGAGTLAQYAWHVDLRIDQLLVSSQVGPYPGRPSPPTALALTALSLAILLIDVRPTRRARPSEWLVSLAGLTGLAAVLGQVFGAGPLYRLGHAPVIGVAVTTALSLLLTSAGLLLERPDAGVMRLAISRGPGGIVFRRLALAAVLAPPVLGFLVTRLLQAFGVEDVPLVFASLAVVMTVAILVLLGTTAARLDRTHEALEEGRAQARDLIEHASDGVFVADLHGRYTDVNSAGCRMLGYSREELVGKTILDVIPPEDVERFDQHREQVLSGHVSVSEWRLLRKDGTLVPVEVSARILPDHRWQGLVRDITDRRRAEDVVRQSQERFELALKGADLAAWDWNIQTGEVIFSPRWAEMRGFRPDEVRPHVDSWIEGIHPDDRSRVESAVDDALERRIPEYETEHRVLTKSAEWIWVLDRGRVFARDAAGRPTRMVGTELDITARKKADDALRLSEAKFSGIISISADAIISIDEEQRITAFNEGAEKIFGYPKAEVIGAPLDVLVPERFRAGHRRHVEAFSRGRDVARRMAERGAAVFGLRKGGEEFPADAAISKLDVGGARVLTVALRDMTEQQRVEREQTFLAEVGTVFVATLDYEDTLASLARLAVRDLADLCSVDVVEESGDLRRVEVVSRDPSKAWVCDLLMQTPLDPARLPLLRQVLDMRKPVLVERVAPETVASWAHGEEHLRALRDLDPRSLIVVPLVAHGKVLGVVNLVSVTPSRPFGPSDVRFSEELARRAALWLENVRLYREAQRASRARDEVLGIVAHDLRNPLGTITMQAQLLRRHGPEPERRSSKPAEVIERAAKRMNRLIQDLLDVTRMEAGRLSLEQARLCARQVVSDCFDAQRALAASASLELSLDVVADVGDVWADGNRLSQVFENLIGNAVKFTKPGGRVTVGAEPKGREILFWVADTGAGISDEERSHVFDRFWQAHGVQHRGSGLGLAITKNIVEAHGGRIWVESAPGRGSTFFFTIPTAPPEAEWRAERASGLVRLPGSEQAPEDSRLDTDGGARK